MLKIRHVIGLVFIFLLFSSVQFNAQTRVVIAGDVRTVIAGYGAEKVLNNEFEAAGGGGGDVFANWEETTAGTSSINQDAVNQYSGANCCRLDIDASSNNVSICTQAIALGANKRYKLSFWYYHSVDGRTGALRVIDSSYTVYLQDDLETWEEEYNGIDIANALSWTKWETEFVTHSSYTDYKIVLLNDYMPSASMYYDQVKLQEVPAKTIIN